MKDHIIIKINGTEYKLKKSFRGLMLFEEMTGQPANSMEENTSNTLKLFYCLIKAANLSTFKFSFDEFVDILDSNESIYADFNNYLIELANAVGTEQKKRTVKGR